MTDHNCLVQYSSTQKKLIMCSKSTAPAQTMHCTRRYSATDQWKRCGYSGNPRRKWCIICGVGQHCEFGKQKLFINVVLDDQVATSLAPSPSTSPSPSQDQPQPSTATITSTTSRFGFMLLIITGFLGLFSA